MRPAFDNKNGLPVLRLAVITFVVSLIVVSPALSYTWLGPFPTVPPVVTGQPPPTDNSVPPIFTWPEPPPGGNDTGNQGPPPPVVVPQSTPEPSTIIAGLIGLGVMGVARTWRKRR
jgi:PEP-CTERM motif